MSGQPNQQTFKNQLKLDFEPRYQVNGWTWIREHKTCVMSDFNFKGKVSDVTRRKHLKKVGKIQNNWSG